MGTANKSGFSALLELVGLRDIAAESAADYHHRFSTFTTALQDVLADNSSTCIVIFFDKCLLVEESERVLTGLLCRLRIRLLCEPQAHLIFRAILWNKYAEIKEFSSRPDDHKKAWRSPRVTLGYSFSPATCELFSLLDRFKGIGIYVAADTKISDPVFVNFFLSRDNARYYAEYTDIGFLADDITDKLASGVINFSAEVISRSPRAARFFIPLLINCVKHCKIDGDASLDEFLNRLCSKDYRQDLQRVKGAELVYVCLIGRLMAEPNEAPEALRKSFLKILRSWGWLVGKIREDDVFPYRYSYHLANHAILRKFLSHASASQKALPFSDSDMTNDGLGT